MTRFIKLTGHYAPHNPIHVRADCVQFFTREDQDRCTGVYLPNGTTVHVRETPDELLALLQAPVDPPEPA